MPTSYLLTGTNGFLGSIIYDKLSQKGYVETLGRGASNGIVCDLATQVPAFNTAFDTVIHNAGKAHIVPKTEAEKQAFFQVNYQGTLNLLKGLENAPVLPKQFIFISTVAVYGLDSGENIDETHPLLGTNPYAKSKILAEEAIGAWCEKHTVNCLILRLPLVFGSHAPGNLGAIASMIQRGSYIRIAGNEARKSIVLGEDVATLISKVEGVNGIYNLTDGEHPRFQDLEDAIAALYGKKVKYALPLSALKLGAKAGDLLQAMKFPFPLTTDRLNKMTASLTFNDDLARRELGWQSRAVLQHIDLLL